MSKLNAKELSNAKNGTVQLAALAVRLKKLFAAAPKSKAEFDKLTMELITKSKELLQVLDKIEL